MPVLDIPVHINIARWGMYVLLHCRQHGFPSNPREHVQKCEESCKN